MENGLEKIVSEGCLVDKVVMKAYEDVSALAIEKFGICPNIQILGNRKAKMMCIESHLYFIFVEILKNSVLAILDRFSHSLTKEEYPPIIVTLSVPDRSLLSLKNELGIKVEDKGGGFSFEVKDRLFKFFHTSQVEAQPTYTYSGGFGAPFAGLGCGLSISRLYARNMGGDIGLESLAGTGSTAFIYLSRKN